MRTFRPTFHKPQLGSPINGGSNLIQGLKLGVILNEFAGCGPDQFGGPNAKIFNILGRNNGVGAGNIGGNGHVCWKMTRQGYGFVNDSSATSGGIDFGPLSNFGTFTQITFAVMACMDNLDSSVARAFICSNVSTGVFGIDSIQASAHWECFVVTTGGTQVVNGTPSHNSDNLYADLVVVTYDGVTLKSYVNGRLSASSTINQALSLDSSAHIFLGGWLGASGQNLRTPATCAYVWNRALTPAEVQQLYLDPYWAVVAKPRSWRAAMPANVPPPPPVPTGIPTDAKGKTGKSGIKQTLITIPEMQSFEDVRQVIAQAINNLQLHIASQLPIQNYQGQRIQNVAMPISPDDVVTMRYLQSIYTPPGTSTKT